MASSRRLRPTKSFVVTSPISSSRRYGKGSKLRWIGLWKTTVLRENEVTAVTWSCEQKCVRIGENGTQQVPLKRSSDSSAQRNVADENGDANPGCSGWWFWIRYSHLRLGGDPSYFDRM